MTLRCAEVAAWLDEYLDVASIEDYPGALNGLQVDGTREIRRVGAATDASLATIDLAIADDCDLLIVHHGLFWNGPEPLVGPPFERIRRLIESGTGVYSSHLPLDAHPEVGNNALLAGELGVAHAERFGTFKGNDGIGVIGSLSVGRDELIGRIRASCRAEPMLIPGGPETVRRVAVITGGGGSMLGAAIEAGADTFVTGEGGHHTYHEAMERGVNLIYAGHYATETIGVRALARTVARRFDVEHAFFDVPTGL
ncbi:MAG: Nif3-like dinuclear metal center hexameric protein [Gemmatimonadetes bacterium]|nr:Nif3-like dinuclear metal center hexameric protein [Gemmatimonadota bacterium]